MKSLYLILAISITLAACNKQEGISLGKKTVYGNVELDDQRTNPSKTSIYSEMALGADNFILLKGYGSYYTHYKSELPYLEVSGVLNSLQSYTDKTFSIGTQTWDVFESSNGDGIGVYNYDLQENNEATTLHGNFGITTKFKIYSGKNTLLSENLYVPLPICATNYEAFDDDYSYVITGNSDLVLSWAADANNSNGVAIIISNGNPEFSDDAMVIKLVNDNGSFTIPYADIADYEEMDEPTVTLLRASELITSASGSSFSVAAIARCSFFLSFE